jgi:hypothetical protein
MASPVPVLPPHVPLPWLSRVLDSAVADYPPGAPRLAYILQHLDNEIAHGGGLTQADLITRDLCASAEVVFGSLSAAAVAGVVPYAADAVYPAGALVGLNGVVYRSAVANNRGHVPGTAGENFWVVVPPPAAPPAPAAAVPVTSTTPRPAAPAAAPLAAAPKAS